MIIGIGGASRSGKTYLAQELKARNEHLSIAIISQDDYVHPENEIPKINNKTDWECPESINFKKFISAVKQANIVSDITIAEGLLIYYHQELSKLFDKKVFIDIDNSTFLKRKTTDLRWGKIEDWYKEHIWKSYLQYGTINSTSKQFLLLNGNSVLDLNNIEHYLEISLLNKN